MTKTPERNLNPPPDDWIECPDCGGTGREPHWTEDGSPGDEYQCPRCDGDGVIPKAEERREIEAVMADKAHDAKMEKEEA